MSLLTIERPTSAASSNEQDDTDSDTVSQSSYDGFYANKHLALAIPHMVRRVSIVSINYSIIGDLQHHLQQLMSMMRPRERIDMVVALEQVNSSKTKYLILVTTLGNEDTEESCLLGTESVNQEFRVVLVIPLWKNTVLKYFGDGGFKLTSGDDSYVFKTSSVPCMWAASNAIYTAVENARDRNYYSGGSSHTWVPYYKDKLTDNRQSLHEWYMMDEVTSFFRPDSPIYNSTSEDPIDDETTIKRSLISQLRENMSHTDLENVTSRELRLQLEAQFNRPLKGYLSFLDEQMLYIFGQMKKPSEILSFLYLGSEWNASNLSELRELGVGYIINISREVDNFFPDTFKYLSIRVYDHESSDLMRHWEMTYKFISEARDNNSKVLIHCKMGVSRSASTVIAFLMKELQMDLETGISHVKERRNCIKPNKGFLEQLKTYEGILNARHKTFWSAMIDKGSHLLRCRSETSLIDNFQYSKRSSEFGQSYSSTNLLPRSWRIELTTEPPNTANDSQSTSDIEPFDSSDSVSPISSSPISQPDETLLQMMSEGSDLPITQLSSEIEQAKREKLEREHQQQIASKPRTEILTTCDINISENSAFQPVAKRQKISSNSKSRPKSAVTSSMYKTNALDTNLNYLVEKQIPKSLPNSPALKKSNKIPLSPTKLSPLLETKPTNSKTAILRPHSAPKSNRDLRPKSEILERTLSTPEVCENKRHTITESIFVKPKETVRLRVQNFESLSLQNIHTACESLSYSPPLTTSSIDMQASSWTVERHSLSTENLSSHSSHELGSCKSRISLNKNSNNANHLSPSLRNTDNERLIENVQAYIQRLESMEKERDDVLASSPRKLPCTLPEQESSVREMKKIFEKDDENLGEKIDDEIELLNLNANNNNNLESLNEDFLIFPYIMESQETDC